MFQSDRILGIIYIVTSYLQNFEIIMSPSFDIPWPDTWYHTFSFVNIFGLDISYFSSFFSMISVSSTAINNVYLFMILSLYPLSILWKRNLWCLSQCNESRKEWRRVNIETLHVLKPQTDGKKLYEIVRIEGMEDLISKLQDINLIKDEFRKNEGYTGKILLLMIILLYSIAAILYIIVKNSILFLAIIPCCIFRNIEYYVSLIVIEVQFFGNFLLKKLSKMKVSRSTDNVVSINDKKMSKYLQFYQRSIGHIPLGFMYIGTFMLYALLFAVVTATFDQTLVLFQFAIWSFFVGLIFVRNLIRGSVFNLYQASGGGWGHRHILLLLINFFQTFVSSMLNKCFDNYHVFL